MGLCNAEDRMPIGWVFRTYIDCSSAKTGAFNGNRVIGATTPAEYRWSFAMGAGSESADIKNKFGSELIISCRSGRQFNIPALILDSKIVQRRSDLYVQFVIDGRNYPVSFFKGNAEPASPHYSAH